MAVVLMIFADIDAHLLSGSRIKPKILLIQYSSLCDQEFGSAPQHSSARADSAPRMFEESFKLLIEFGYGSLKDCRNVHLNMGWYLVV